MFAKSLYLRRFLKLLETVEDAAGEWLKCTAV
jgi:hypothetical protein